MTDIINYYLNMGNYTAVFDSSEPSELDGKKGFWRTINGHKVFIPEGTAEEQTQAVKAHFEKVSKYNKIQKKYFEVSDNEKERFKKDVNELLNSQIKFNKDTVKVGDVPYIYQFLGISKGSVYIEKGNIRKDMGFIKKGKKHDVDIKEIEKIPELYSDPLIVMKSKTQENALVAVLNATDKSGRQIVLALHPDKYGKGQHAIPSAYGKDDIVRFLEEATNEKRIIYIQNKKTIKKSLALIAADFLMVDNSIAEKSKIIKSFLADETATQDEIEQEIAGCIGGCFGFREDIEKEKNIKAYLHGYFTGLEHLKKKEENLRRLELEADEEMERFLSRTNN